MGKALGSEAETRSLLTELLKRGHQLREVSQRKADARGFQSHVEPKELHKSNKQNRSRLTDTETRLRVPSGEGGWGLGAKGEGVKKAELVVTKQSQ